LLGRRAFDRRGGHWPCGHARVADADVRAELRGKRQWPRVL